MVSEISIHNISQRIMWIYLKWTGNIYIGLMGSFWNFAHTVTTNHYCDVIMDAMASQITSLTIVYSTIHSCADPRKHQSSASLAFVRSIHRGPVNFPHKWAVMGKCFHLMTSSCSVTGGLNIPLQNTCLWKPIVMGHTRYLQSCKHYLGFTGFESTSVVFPNMMFME